MKIIVPIQLVPDLVEELEINDEGNDLDRDFMRWIISEFDEHAIEQAILIKEESGAEVTILAIDFDEIDDTLFTAAAKGADQLIKITGDFEDNPINTHALARIFAPVIKQQQPDLILTGVQTHNSFDGALGPMLAELLDTPYIGYVSDIKVSNDKAVVQKEYPGGLIAEMTATLPVVLGIQSAASPPRYVPVSKVRQAMKTGQIDEEDDGEIDTSGGPAVSTMLIPEPAEKAEMLDGDIEEVADRLIDIFKHQGIL